MHCALKAKANDLINQLRPVGLVPTTLKCGLSLLGSVGDRIAMTRTNAFAYRHGVGLDTAAVPVLLVAQEAVEWRDDLVLWCGGRLERGGLPLY